jgi:hypothetical protein
MGARHEHHAWDLRRGGNGDQEGRGHGPKGLGPKASGSRERGAQQPPCFWAPNDVVGYTTEELLNITT